MAFVLVFVLTPRNLAILQAADGDLDKSFGSGGKVITDFKGSDARAIALQKDGKILVAGSAISINRGPDFALARYNNNGTIDASFGNGGMVATDFGGSLDLGNAMSLQSDGKILVAGVANVSNGGQNFALARYNNNGFLDASFGGGGKVTTDFTGDQDEAYSVAVQSDSKIIVAGVAKQRTGGENFALVRYNRSGNLDESFGSGGKVTTDFAGGLDRLRAMTIQNDGKIVVAGFAVLNIGGGDFALARYNSNGTLDANFGTGGKVIIDFNGYYDSAQAIVLQNDGKIIVAGGAHRVRNPVAVTPDFALARFNNDGSLDASFGRLGKVTTDFNAFAAEVFAVTLQPDGRIVAAGSADEDITKGGQNFAVARYTNNGTLDPSFGIGGKVTTDFNGSIDVAYAMALPSDGAIVTAGVAYQGGNITRFALVRYLASTPPTSISTSGSLIFSSHGDGNQEVYLLDLTTGRQTNLTKNRADDGYAKWSPDGQIIAFSTNRDGKWQVYLMNRDGTGQRNLTKDPHDTGYVDWSPGGQSLVFASSRYGPKDDIIVSAADGSNVKRLTDDAAEDVHPVWSPDRTKIAFSSERDGNRQIYVMNADGSNPRRLNQNRWYDDYPSWSPDGLQLAFASNRDSGDSQKLDIYVMDADGSNVRRVVADPADDLHPTWSPDGKMLAFSSDRFGERDIFIANKDGSGVRRVVSIPGNDEHPHWNLASSGIPLSRSGGFACESLSYEQYEQLRRALLSGAGNLSQGWCNRNSANYTSCGDRLLQYLHPGVDYSAGVGTPVYAAAGGRVLRVEQGRDCQRIDCLSTLAIYDGQKDKTYVYLHMNTISLKPGGPLVRAGQEIGTVGRRGPVTGPHLHYEVRSGQRTFAALCIDSTVNPYLSTF